MASFGDDFRAAALRASPRIIFRKMKGWVFSLSFGMGGPYWHLSAQLDPKGRGSTEQNWVYMGTVLLAVGVPDPIKASLTPEESTPPDAIRHWTWNRDGSLLDEETMASLRVALQQAYSPV